MIKPTTLLLLCLLPLFTKAQKQDSFRKTDVVKSRMTIELIGRFSSFNTKLNFPVKYQQNITSSGGYNYNGGFGISSEYKLRNRYWLYVGVNYGVYDMGRIQIQYQNRLNVPLALSYDLNNSSHPFYITAGMQYYNIFTFFMGDSDDADETLGEYDFNAPSSSRVYPYNRTHYDNKYNHKHSSLEWLASFGKFFKYGNNLDLRIEGFINYTVGSSIENPNKGKITTLGFKVAATSFFHKWEKVE